MDRRGALKLASAGALATVGASTVSGSAKATAQPDQPVKVGCACNLTGKDVVVYITSGRAVVSALLKKDQCFYFNFVDDKKNRVLSAFALPNELVAHFAFVPVANACLLIEADVKEPKIGKDRFAPKDAVTTLPI